MTTHDVTLPPFDGGPPGGAPIVPHEGLTSSHSTPLVSVPTPPSAIFYHGDIPDPFPGTPDPYADNPDNFGRVVTSFNPDQFGTVVPQLLERAAKASGNVGRKVYGITNFLFKLVGLAAGIGVGFSIGIKGGIVAGLAALGPVGWGLLAGAAVLALICYAAKRDLKNATNQTIQALGIHHEMFEARKIIDRPIKVKSEEEKVLVQRLFHRLHNAYAALSRDIVENQKTVENISKERIEQFEKLALEQHDLIARLIEQNVQVEI